MTRKILKLALATLLLTPAFALAAVPSTMAFSARVADNGQPVNTPQNFTFKLWDVATAGTVGVDDIWTESQTGIAVNNGVVATTLGDVANGGTALPAFTGAPLWLEVTMGSTTFSPRIALQSVPYAFRAAVADRISGCTTVTATAAFPNTAFVSVTASCPAGMVATGGGHYAYSCFLFFCSYPAVSLNYQFTGDQYHQTEATNSSGSDLTLLSFVRCCGTP
jgi:hypothetical protein